MKKDGLFSTIIFCSTLVLVCGFCLCGREKEEEEEEEEEEEDVAMLNFGGLNSYWNNRNAEMKSLGSFAVEEHNKRENAVLEFGKVLRAKEQVVAGKMYYLTLEATDGGKKKIYEAKVWVKSWMNFKQLQEFKQAGYGTSF